MSLSVLALFLGVFLVTVLVVVAGLVVGIRFVVKTVEDQVVSSVREIVAVIGETTASTVERTVGALGRMTEGVVDEVKGGSGLIPDTPEADAEQASAPPWMSWGVTDEDHTDPTDGLLADPPPFVAADRAASVPPGFNPIP